MLVAIDDKIYNRLSAICEMAEQNPTEIINKQIEIHVNMFCDDNGNFNPKVATFYDYEDYKMEKLVEQGTCYVLSEMTVLGNEYYKIFHDGILMKVPKDRVKFT